MEEKLRIPTSKVIPMAFPKGQKKLCELCRQEAYLKCELCRVTYYCSENHQERDWAGIHEIICQKLISIRTTSFDLQESSYGKLQKKKIDLIELCKWVAQSKLSEGRYKEALPAAQFCLRSSLEVYGTFTIELVPAYLLLAESNMGLGNLALVAENLSQAEWVVLKNPQCGFSICHRLHRSLGRLHAATGKLDEALFHFSSDIYLASEEYGLDSTILCGGYFLMADVFARQGKLPVVLSLYGEIANSWSKHLIELFEKHKDAPEKAIDFSQRTEVDLMLRAILEVEQNQYRRNSSQISQVAYCLAMLWFLGRDYQKAEGFAHTSLQASLLIPKHDMTETIQDLLENINEHLPETVIS